jgi:hypothetical protein
MHAVYLFVGFADLVCKVLVAVHERIKRVPDHVSGNAPHVVEIVTIHDLGTEFGHPLHDVDGQVSDPFQIVIDLHYRNNGPEITRDGLLKGKKGKALLLQPDLGKIDLVINHPDFPACLGILLPDGLQSIVNITENLV